MRLHGTYTPTPEQTLGALAILGLIGAAIYGFCQWLLACPRTPDPWGSDVEQAVAGGEAVPLCPHCLTPQEHDGWFCPECGSTTGQYGNYLPSVYIFSVGDAARAGVRQQAPWTPLLVAGYVLSAFAWLSIFAPIYCLLLCLNRSRISHPEQQSEANESEA